MRAADLKVGMRIVLQYEGDELWHERLLVEPVVSPSWVVMTPTLDLHEEDVLHPEVKTVCGGPRGGLRQLAGQAVFRFDRD